MLDDLRKSALQHDADVEIEEPLPSMEDAEEEVEARFLGMTAVERMFLSIFVFLNVVVIGTALLLVTGRLVL